MMSWMTRNATCTRGRERLGAHATRRGCERREGVRTSRRGRERLEGGMRIAEGRVHLGRAHISGGGHMQNLLFKKRFNIFSNTIPDM